MTILSTDTTGAGVRWYGGDLKTRTGRRYIGREMWTEDGSHMGGIEDYDLKPKQ